MPCSIALYLAGKLPVDRLMSGVIALDDISAGYNRLPNGSVIRQFVRTGSGRARRLAQERGSKAMTEGLSNSPYAHGLARNAVNFAVLSPLGFLARAAAVYPERVALIHGAERTRWADCYMRCRRLASALAKRGIGRGDTVAVMGPNVPAIYEAHFGVPMAGAVLNALNTRLDAEAIAFQLAHGEAKMLMVDREHAPIAARAMAQLDRPISVIDIHDPLYDGDNAGIGEKDYEALLAEGDPEFVWTPPADEFDPIALNYTSGTTGNPKGVVTHHRGAYLNAVSQLLSWQMPTHSTYLWTLPMFHCNGWCFPWAMAANAGASVCLRKVEPRAVFDAIRAHRVTHMCGAPIVYSMLMTAPAEVRG